MGIRFFSGVWVVALLLSGCGGGGGGGSTAPVPAVFPGTKVSVAPTASPTASPSATPSPVASSSVIVFALANDAQYPGGTPALAANANVDGVASAFSWSTLETQPGVYAWQAIDSAISAVTAVNKRATLHIFSSVYGSPPAWLAGMGAQFYTYTNPTGAQVSDPVPWDATYLSRWTSFINGLAQHLSSAGTTGALAQISLTTPVPEMSLISCRNGTLAPGIPYSRSAYLAAWEQMVDAYQAAFPATAKLISAPAGTICADGDLQFYRDVMNYALGKSSTFELYAADLTASGSSRMSNYTSYAGAAKLGLQTIWSATGDPSHRLGGTLQQALCAGVHLGATYLEVYAADLASGDASIPAAISAAKNGGC